MSMETSTVDFGEHADVERHLSGTSPRGVPAHTNGANGTNGTNGTTKPKQRSRRKNPAQEDDAAKRRCVSTACIACRKRKSKCDGNLPACAACSQVYGTECVYDPNSDHRRKGVYKNDIDNLKTRNSTLQTLIQAILNYPEDDVPALIRDIRTCESLDTVAERIVAKEGGITTEDEEDNDVSPDFGATIPKEPTFESNLYGKMGELRLDEGSVRYIGGTSNLIHLASEEELAPFHDDPAQQEDAVTSWTNVTNDPDLISHLLNMYFTWHYTYFTILPKDLFYRDFYLGRPPEHSRRSTYYCTALLVNAMLALGCHFTSNPGAREDPDDSATAGDHFFREAKRLLMANDEHEKPHITTVQALALLSVREAGCGREARGWVYSGMSFRMACDIGLNLDASHLTTNKHMSNDDKEEDARRITFWGCYLFDKCWSNYMGRLPQLPTSLVTVSKYEVFPDEEASQWSPYTDSGFTQALAQPSRTRVVALQIIKLCEISNDLMKHFYNPTDMEKTKGKAAELRKLSDIHTRLEAWRRELPKELEPKEGGLSSVLVMHMFFQLLFIHLFRPFLKYTQTTSPLPHAVSPRKLCTQAAGMISKLMRLYKRSHGLRQICNIAVYICHSACTIHLLNLPDKNARRDIVHGVNHLEEIAESWLCARRTLGILGVLANKWKIELPEDAAAVLHRAEIKFGPYQSDANSPSSQKRMSVSDHLMTSQAVPQQHWSAPAYPPTAAGYPPNAQRSASISGGAGVSGAMRTSSGNLNMPPRDANGLRAQQYPSAQTTPQASLLRRRSEATNVSSPSEMFGGIEQLIRDSQDWAYRDQQQLANGFENWTSIEIDPAAWAANGAGGVNGSGMTSHPVNSNGTATGVPTISPPNGILPPRTSNSRQSLGHGPVAVPGNGGGSLATMAEWLNSMNTYNSMAASYNEDEWYQ